MEWQAYISPALNLLVLLTIILGVKANRDMINNYRVMNGLDLDLLKIQLEEKDVRIKTLTDLMHDYNDQRISSILHITTKIEETGISINKILDRQNENDVQIAMLCTRLRVQREESMSLALKDATMNPEKYTMGAFETITVAKDEIS